MERFPLADPSQIGAARREAVRIAAECGMPEEDRARLAIVVTELSTNTIWHGGGGEMLIGRRATDDCPSLEAIWSDKGPGMVDPEACLRDGYSSKGTSGTGFGAAVRLSDGFDCYSRAGQGTVVLARLRAGRAPAAVAGDWQVGAVAVPKSGEPVSGDAWAVRQDGTLLCCMVVDGLGHGPQAAEAAAAAVDQFESAPACDAVAIIERVHAGMRATRGGAVAVACVDRSRRTVAYCGVGNIAGAVAGTGLRRMVSLNGTAGGVASRIRSFDYAFEAGAAILLHSDGLSASWSTAPYPGLMAHDPTVIAGVLFRDQERGRDDATILVVREQPA